MDTPHTVIILVADGVRPDTLSAAMGDGTLPALARLREEGAYHTVTTAFPSVTGPAYAPFLLGRFPGPAGLPGLRWYDRARTACGWPSHARSYVGIEMRHVDRDLAPETPTLFEVAPSSLAALSVIGRGLASRARLDRGVRFAARVARTHFRGDVRGWLAIDRKIGETLVRRVRDERPVFTFAAFTGVDKTSHAAGQEAPIVREALRIVDRVVGQLRTDAERAGRWETTHLWIVSDHGHSPVARHDDLADAVRGLGARVIAHPRVFTRRPDVAVMVSGNAMAHLYLALDERERPYWPALRRRRVGGTALDGEGFVQWLARRASVDLVILPTAPGSCEIVTLDRGRAVLSWVEPGGRGGGTPELLPVAHLSVSSRQSTLLRPPAAPTLASRDARFTYTPYDGDPLGIGALRDVTADETYAATLGSDYPDALVQIAALCAAPRVGDIILSAARQWDYRGRYEPIPHVSSHGALHREHMLVPLLTNHPIAGIPRRTVDVMPSVAALLGHRVANIDGMSFVGDHQP